MASTSGRGCNSFEATRHRRSVSSWCSTRWRRPRCLCARAAFEERSNKNEQAGKVKADAGETLALVEARDSIDKHDSGPLQDVQLHSVLRKPSAMRQLTGVSTADECIAQFLELADEQQAVAVLSEYDCMHLITSAFDRGNFELAKSIYNATGRNNSQSRSAVSSMVSSTNSQQWGWPAATLKSTELMVLLFARELQVQEALDVVARIRSRGMPASDEVPFGMVVSSPLAPDQPLTVVQPQEGCKIVACASTRYELEVFSGNVMPDTKSEALNAASSGILAFFSRSTPCQATHDLVVRSPDGISRTFKVGTESAQLPAESGDRVSIICSPPLGSKLRKAGVAGFLSSRPPRTRPGEPLALVNHRLGSEARLVPPPSAVQKALPAWSLPAAAAFLGITDWGSGFIDPNYPALFAAGVATLAVSSIGSTKVLLPRLKMLPDTQVAVEEVQQSLLQQHSDLMRKARALHGTVKENVRLLARMWQLQVKMQSIGNAYDARLTRVVEARAVLEEQLCQRLALLERYSRIASIIEIEVEMNTEVPQADIDDIENQIRDLNEVEDMQADWELQVEAQDELERLLRATP